MLWSHLEKPPTWQLTNYPYKTLYCFGLVTRIIKCQLLCSYKLAKVCKPQQYNISFNSKQLFLKGSDLYIITPEHNQITLSFTIKKISECIYQYLNWQITATIFQTIPKTNSLTALFFQCTNIAAIYTCAQQYIHEQPHGTTHLPPMFTSRHTDNAFGHWAAIWLKAGKLDYSSLLYPCCGTWLSSGSHCWAPALFREAALRLWASIQVGPTTFSSSGGMASPFGTVTWAERLSLCHIYLLPYPYHLGRARQLTVASSTAEKHNTIWYLSHPCTMDTKDAPASFTIEGHLAAPIFNPLLA